MLDKEKHELVMTQILKDIFTDVAIAPFLGFKGGTAAYFFYELPRFFVHISLSLLITSPFLFFVHDKTFLRWAKFAGIWFFLSGIFVYLSPEYQGGWLGIGPEKESVSILMGILFVIISLPLLFLSERREGKE